VQGYYIVKLSINIAVSQTDSTAVLPYGFKTILATGTMKLDVFTVIKSDLKSEQVLKGIERSLHNEFVGLEGKGTVLAELFSGEWEALETMSYIPKEKLGEITISIPMSEQAPPAQELSPNL